MRQNFKTNTRPSFSYSTFSP